MLPYQRQVIESFTKLLPRGATDILEIGSDVGGEVALALAQRTGARVVGINPAPEFPPAAPALAPNVRLLRADGRSMPFADRAFDAVLSVATMEHVNGLDAFLAEVARVLKPRGLFFAEFSPIWSSARGHHVFAVAGAKEARFWKPGKNPIPDYGHLLLTPDEMRAQLRSGPCTEELIEPIIQWIYQGDSINRCHFEEYMEAFHRCPLLLQRIGFGHDLPDRDTLGRLRDMYGDKTNFTCSFISAVFRRSPEGAFQRLLFRSSLGVRRFLGGFLRKQWHRMKVAWRMLAAPLSR